MIVDLIRHVTCKRGRGRESTGAIKAKRLTQADLPIALMSKPANPFRYFNSSHEVSLRASRRFGHLHQSGVT